MTDTDFARIKARFPALRWKRKGNYAFGSHCEGLRIEIDVSDGAWQWTWWPVRGQISCWENDRRLTTLGRCLRSLECAIIREARTLAGMVGQEVAL